MFIWGIIWFTYLRCTFENSFENSSIGALETHESFFSSIKNFLWFYFFWRWKKCCTPHFLNSPCFWTPPYWWCRYLQQHVCVCVWSHPPIALGNGKWTWCYPTPKQAAPPSPIPWEWHQDKATALSLCNPCQATSQHKVSACYEEPVDSTSLWKMVILQRPGEYLKNLWSPPNFKFLLLPPVLWNLHWLMYIICFILYFPDFVQFVYKCNNVV